jgi:hypothetical protein
LAWRVCSSTSSCPSRLLVHLSAWRSLVRAISFLESANTLYSMSYNAIYIILYILSSGLLTNFNGAVAWLDRWR